MNHIMASLRLTIATLFICSVAYPLFILIAGKAVTPHTSNGSLSMSYDGKVIGSELIAQPFTKPEYLWPRPSAVDYNGAGAGGSNLSPTNPALREKAIDTLKTYGAGWQKSVPADLVSASGSGLDPHITLQGAMFQAGRIADARCVSEKTVEKVIMDNSFTPGWFFTNEPLVNVLKANIALDGLKGR